VITAVTASVVGSILATVLPGPLETQIEPKPAVTSWADGKGIVASRVPPAGALYPPSKIVRARSRELPPGRTGRRR